MIIVDDLPFGFVEENSFQAFCGALEPRFFLPTRHDVVKDCFQIFFDEKIKLKNLLKARSSERVCLTTNVWTSERGGNYVVTAAHFIDDYWNLQRKILSICQIHDLEGVTIAEVVEKCLREWGIERVFTITTDNAGYNDEVISYLVKKIEIWNGQVLENGFIHVTCFAHILNLIVSDSLRELSDSIDKIRNAVRCVWYSSEYSLQFQRCMKEENLPVKSLVYLDVPSMWNTTYVMLDAAVKRHKAFDRLENQNAEYVLELNEDESIMGPSLEDWENAHVLVNFLKVFHDVTSKISNSSSITSSMFLEQCVLLHELILKYSSSDDPLSSSMARSMKTKYEKYWGDTNKTNYLLYVATVLDPRYKMGFVEYCFNLLYGSEVGSEMAKKVDRTLRSLYDEYKINHSDPYNDRGGHGALPSTKMSAGSTETLTKRFRRHLDEVNAMEKKTEVDFYLAESLEIPNDAFNVLHWWKVNSSKYKILGCIAKDVLAIPISTMASRSTFSTDGNVVNPCNSVYYPKTLEALICAQNWLQPSTDLDLQQKIEAIELAGDEVSSFDDYAPDSN